MKRRGFLGLMGGAAVAGPSMAKQAATATLADMNLGGMARGLSSQTGGYATTGLGDQNTVGGWAEDLARLSLRSQAEHEHRQRDQHITGLDPDLLCNRSMALHRKIAIQKRREYWRGVESHKSWIQRRIDGIFDW